MTQKSSLDRKKESLLKLLASYRSALVAYSGGVDSTLLAFMLYKVLKKKALSVTFKTPMVSKRELLASQRIIKSLGVPCHVVHLDMLVNPDFIRNNSRRCYFCKKRMFQEVRKIAAEKDIPYVLHGANKSDLTDVRPGMVAAEEYDIKAPFIEMDLNKEDIRIISKSYGLETWNKPAMACLATRVLSNIPITGNLLGKIEQIEDVMYDAGVKNCRARIHGMVVRLEIDENDFHIFSDKKRRNKISAKIKETGFTYISLDIDGYRQGSMNG